ncbi:IS66 family insertion sequence element accessory protein TnpA [Sporosarcina saromensis]|uniref:Phage ABA sandwich domain-containing protein n=2 Tax=Sporosarcina TaxID=1569 RepID=A0ABU4GEG6_9BACL|nr:hypothetical protein [Sporosarcina saromensis]MDW0115316.1 hypothetical protein [Sporosarcina saromensis]
MSELANPSAIHDEKDARWIEIIEQWKDSGMTMSEWIRGQDEVTYYQLVNARRRLYPEEVYGTGKPNTWSAITMELPSSSMNVHVNGLYIEVPPGFDRTLLLEIVEVLKDAN